jgi:hypothetical protein
LIDLTERMMFMQAWASYGISWTIVRCLLGIDADIPAGRLSVVPQIPPSWPGLAARRLRMGEASIAVSAERDDRCYRTTVEAPAGLRLTIGHTLPAGLEIEAATLDGAPTAYEVVETIRGREVRVETSTGTVHMLAVTAGRERVHLSAEHTSLAGTLVGDTLHIPARQDKQPLEHTSTAQAPHTPFDQYQPS